VSGRGVFGLDEQVLHDERQVGGEENGRILGVVHRCLRGWAFTLPKRLDGASAASCPSAEMHPHRAVRALEVTTVCQDLPDLHLRLHLKDSTAVVAAVRGGAMTARQLGADDADQPRPRDTRVAFRRSACLRVRSRGNLEVRAMVSVSAQSRSCVDAQGRDLAQLPMIGTSPAGIATRDELKQIAEL